MDEDMKEYKEKIKNHITNRLTFHFDEIQKIITEREKGTVDINLDILYKFHINCHSELIRINRILDGV